MDFVLQISQKKISNSLKHMLICKQKLFIVINLHRTNIYI